MEKDSAQVKEIIEVATKIVEVHGTTTRLKNAGSIRTAEVDGFQLTMTTPFTRIKTGKGDYAYTIDIKDKSRRTLFAAGWAPQKRWGDQLKVFAFSGKRDGWIDRFLGLNKAKK